MRFYCFVMLFVLCIIFLSNCKKEQYDCEFFENIHEIDQEIRRDRRFNVILYIADSLGLDEDKNSVERSNEIRREAYSIFKNADFQSHLFIDTIVADSLGEMMMLNDQNNIRLMLDAIKSTDKAILDTMSCFNSALITFAHTPDEQIEEVAETLEYIKDILSENRYNNLKRRVDQILKQKELYQKDN